MSNVASSNRPPKGSGAIKWLFALTAAPAFACASGLDGSAPESTSASTTASETGTLAPNEAASTVSQEAAPSAEAAMATNVTPGQPAVADAGALPSPQATDLGGAVPVPEAAALSTDSAAAAPMNVAEAGSPLVGRPAFNTGSGFFVQNRTIYDANGAEFRMRGVNHTHWWGSNETEAIPFMRRANVNTVRAVFGPGQSDAATPAARQAVAEQYIAQGIVPLVDYHNATCDEDPASLAAAVDFWLGPDKAWLQSLERYVIVNISNEWGPNSTVWRDAYKTAVARIRAAGVKNMLVIDAGGACGQNAESIETWGREIFDSDPEKNVVFSVHMYGFWKDPGDPLVGTWDGHQPYDIDGELTRLDATGLPIIVGEFSWDAFEQVTYTTKAALTAYEKHGVGWLAWMWFNPGGDVTVDMAKSNSYTQSSDLTDFGHLVVEDPSVGLLAKARPATIF